MKGYRFYLEYGSKANKRKGIHEGNVVAIMDTLDDGFRPQFLGAGNLGYEAISAVYFHPNSAVAGTSAAVGYLRDNCKRIPERIARQIHPRLFERIDEHVA